MLKDKGRKENGTTTEPSEGEDGARKSCERTVSQNENWNVGCHLLGRGGPYFCSRVKRQIRNNVEKVAKYLQWQCKTK